MNQGVTMDKCNRFAVLNDECDDLTSCVSFGGEILNEIDGTVSDIDVVSGYYGDIDGQSNIVDSEFSFDESWIDEECDFDAGAKLLESMRCMCDECQPILECRNCGIWYFNLDNCNPYCGSCELVDWDLESLFLVEEKEEDLIFVVFKGMLMCVDRNDPIVSFCNRPSTGHEDFIVNGGESNPGPVYSTLSNVAKGATIAAFRALFPQHATWYAQMSEIARKAGDYSVVFLHLLRVYTSMIDCVSTFLYRLAAVTSLDLYSRLAVFCLNVYESFTMFSEKMGLTVTLRPVVVARPQAGPLETFCIATFLSAMLPKPLHGLIKDIPTFTNFRLLDDATWVFDFFSFLVSLPMRICKLLFVRDEKTSFIFDFLTKVEDFLPFSSLSKYHYQLKEILDLVDRKPSLVGDAGFQDKVEALNVQYKRYRNVFLEDRKELPPYMQSQDKRFRNLVVKIDYMRSNIRVEPVACVFAGLRGTGKTTLMNVIVGGFAAQNSVYCHMSQEDKDFHDQYDNEDVYVVDDIGQKGTWQWSGMINFVSTTKCPLLCADAEKKGTKFFTSRLIFASTNNINPTLTANCGITDIGALQRRLINFSFDHIKFVNGKYYGYIQVMKYDLELSRWKDDARFDAHGGELDVVKISEYIKGNLIEKKNNMAIYERKYDFGAMPQALFDEVKLAPAKVKAYFTTLFRNCIDFQLPELNAEQVAFGTFCSLFVYGVYRCFEMFFENVDAIPQKSKDLQYTARKKPRVSIRSALPQSLNSLFSVVEQSEDIPQLRRVANQTVVVEANFLVKGRNCTSYFSSVISGRYLTAPLHSLNLEVGTDLYVSVYVTPTSLYYDKVKGVIKYVAYRDDLAVIELPLFLPKYFKNIVLPLDSAVTEMVMCKPGGVEAVEPSLTELDCRISYKQFETGYNGVITQENSVLYEAQDDGTCGSMLFTRDGYLLGHHVAMVIGDRAYGCARIFSKRSIDKLRELFAEPIDYAVKVAREIVDGSIVRIDDKVYHHSNDKTTYVDSLMSGVFEKGRAPANLSVFGRDTVKMMSMKSRQKVSALDINALEYAEQYMDSLLEPVDVLQSEKQVVLGHDSLGRIDPHTSVGYGLKGIKADYLDFESGKIGVEMREHVGEFCSQVVDGSYKFDTYYAETLKDELKDIGKVNKPRVFKGGPLILTLLYRYFLGNLMADVSKKRLTNGIMVGVNPLSCEWDELARKVVAFSPCVFDGDWKFWDGGMLTQAQQRACDVLKKKVFRRSDNGVFNWIFETELSEQHYEKVFDMLMVLLYNTPTVTTNEAFITTHSMPSGCAATAFFNSLINKGYGAYIFAVLHEEKYGVLPSVNLYREKVVDFVYGDDKLTAVKEDVASWYNGRTFSQVAVKMGLDFTPADKGEWKYDTRSVFDCSFLKRGFYVHPIIGKVVAPLEVTSMCGTLNYVSDGFRNDVLTGVKIQNFQREAFLHHKIYDELMCRVRQVMSERNIKVELLTQEYLLKLYVVGEYGDFLDLN